MTSFVLQQLAITWNRIETSDMQHVNLEASVMLRAAKAKVRFSQESYDHAFPTLGISCQDLRRLAAMLGATATQVLVYNGLPGSSLQFLDLP